MTKTVISKATGEEILINAARFNPKLHNEIGAKKIVKKPVKTKKK